MLSVLPSVFSPSALWQLLMRFLDRSDFETAFHLSFPRATALGFLVGILRIAKYVAQESIADERILRISKSTNAMNDRVGVQLYARLQRTKGGAGVLLWVPELAQAVRHRGCSAPRLRILRKVSRARSKPRGSMWTVPWNGRSMSAMAIRINDNINASDTT